MLPKNIEHKLVSELKNKFHDELLSIVLFGSYVRGTAQKYSDIDILIILDRKFTDETERMNLEIELRKKLYRTVGQVSTKTASIDELEEALEGFNPLILNILNSGILLFDDGSFNNLKDHFRYIVPGKIVLRKDHWEVVA
jgi:hypothetical protein